MLELLLKERIKFRYMFITYSNKFHLSNLFSLFFINETINFTYFYDISYYQYYLTPQVYQLLILIGLNVIFSKWNELPNQIMTQFQSPYKLLNSSFSWTLHSISEYHHLISTWNKIFVSFRLKLNKLPDASASNLISNLCTILKPKPEMLLLFSWN